MVRPKPTCRRHPGSTVWFDGKYGAPGHRRQRYRCVPGNGERWHRFTETLPRLHGGTGECLECERGYEAHEGPPTGRQFHYSTRDIAHALLRVGEGVSDRSAGWSVRDRARRLRVGEKRSGRARKNNDGNTVADWVELYAPAIFETLRPTAWPGIVALDSLAFAVRATNAATGAPLQGGEVVFNILAASGWEHGATSEGSVLVLRAFPNFRLTQGTPHWLEFLRDLQTQLGAGGPTQFVCDQDRDILRALDLVWPRGSAGAPALFICHSHLRSKLTTILTESGVAYTDPLRDAIDHQKGKYLCPCAFCLEASWQAFAQAARARKIPRLVSWLNRNAQLIAWQLAHKDKPRRARLSVGALEQVLTEVRDAYKYRAGMIHNRERLDRRLMLAQLHFNKQANLSHYAKVIRDELLKNEGFGGARYLVDDKAGSSLRIC